MAQETEHVGNESLLITEQQRHRTASIEGLLVRLQKAHLVIEERPSGDTVSYVVIKEPQEGANPAMPTPERPATAEEVANATRV